MIQSALTGVAVTLTGTSVINRVIASSMNLVQATLNFFVFGQHTSSALKDVKRHILEMDISIKLRLMLLFTNKENKTQNELIICEISVDLITDIESLLQKINEKIKAFQELWFQNYRTLDVADDLAELETLVHILDERLHLLTKA